ncbi:MAG: hypothetical protein QOJ46_64 [bacterium]|jgi:hypothetical protein
MAYHGLDTYLTDHLAGATAGLNLVRLAAEEHQGDEHGAFFGDLAVEIREDYETLEKLMDSLAVDKSATKTALAEVGTKVMSPKFTGDDDALNAFITLETLSIGVEGKHCMWQALNTLDDPTLDNLDIDALIARAQDQRKRLEDQRLAIAPQALAHTVSA